MDRRRDLSLSGVFAKGPEALSEVAILGGFDDGFFFEHFEVLSGDAFEVLPIPALAPVTTTVRRVSAPVVR